MLVFVAVSTIVATFCDAINTAFVIGEAQATVLLTARELNGDIMARLGVPA